MFTVKIVKRKLARTKPFSLNLAENTCKGSSFWDFIQLGRVDQTITFFYNMLKRIVSYDNYGWCILEYILYDGRIIVSNVTCIMKRSLSVFHRNCIRRIAWKLAIWVVAFDNNNSSIINQIGEYWRAIIRRNHLGESKGYNNLCFKHYFVISHSNSLYICRILVSMSTFS